MIFATEHAITDIIAGKKTQTRRLVKKGELFTGRFMHREILKVLYWGKRPLRSEDDSNARIKWQVGRDYAVQSGRGKPALQICTTCRKTFVFPDTTCGKHAGSKQLRIRITSIRKEKLLDISEEDAKKEGFKNKDEFWKAFTSINNPKNGGRYVNPDVWVLGFEKV